jgi:predicted lipoprotein with Yx(FWY)xxD motif
MKRPLISGAVIALVALAAVVLVVALGSGGGGGKHSATAANPSASGNTVSVAEIGDAGRVLVDSSGQALYASDVEAAAGKVLCTDACTSFWTPLTVSGDAPKGGSLAAKLGVVQRPDGARQVTYNGKPLYSFAEEGPGEVTGDGFTDAFDGRQFVWRVVSVGNGGGSPASSSSSGGSYGY